MRGRALLGAATRTTVLVALAIGTISGDALAASAPEVGRPFEPRPVSEPLYDIQAPEEDPARQRHIVTAADGVAIWTETWLPKAKDGNTPPPRLPTVLYFSPYANRSHPGFSTARDAMQNLVPRGYAWTVAHMRGSGGSNGCFDGIGPRTIDDGGRIVEYLGRDAPWSTGTVGMYGLSNPGAIQLRLAALGDPNRTKYLKAIVPAGPVASWYDQFFQDGVPWFAFAPAAPPLFFLQEIVLGDLSSTTDVDRMLQRPGCLYEEEAGSANTTGDYTDFARERESRRGMQNIRAAVLMVHGHNDVQVPTIVQAGLFDHLPPSTPKAGVFGVFDHDFPDLHDSQDPPVQPDWERPDWFPMVVAWYDRHLKGLDSGTEDWPVAQVQGTDGQWRAERDWPATGGPAAHLALGPASALGVARPTGSTTYTEGALENTRSEEYPPGTSATFETGPLPNRLELTGQAALDLWVSLDRPDAHLATKLEVLDSSGQVVPLARTTGLRSMQHLDPLVDNRFEQAHPKPPAVDTPIRVLLRLQPRDLVVEAGWRLRLTLAGSVIVNQGLDEVREGAGLGAQGPSQPSGSPTRVTVLHDCRHPSVLRFVMPEARPDLLNVREKDEPAGNQLADNRPYPAPSMDAGGLATAPVCGVGPERLSLFGPRAADSRGTCLARRSPIGPRNIGRVRLGYSRRRLLRRVPVRPVRRTRDAYRYCVNGRRGRVTAVFSRRLRRGRVALVTTSAPGHGNRNVRVRSGAAKFRRAYPNRHRLGRGLYRASPRSPRILGVRKGRVRFIAVANRRLLPNRRALRRALRRAGVRPR